MSAHLNESCRMTDWNFADDTALLCDGHYSLQDMTTKLHDQQWCSSMALALVLKKDTFLVFLFLALKLQSLTLALKAAWVLGLESWVLGIGFALQHIFVIFLEFCFFSR